MEKNLFRSLTVLADGEQVTGFCCARLTGREALGLLLEAIEKPEEHKHRQVTVEGMLDEGETLAEI